MARNGVWELEKVLLRYCATGGSSRGTREFVEKSLIRFAEKNPQVQFHTQIKSGHPTVYADYITGYKRNRTVKNLTAKEVGSVLQELRDTLGRRVPRHNEISLGVVERKRLSVQGVWRNLPDMNVEPADRESHRRAVREQHGFEDLVDEVGISGVVSITKQLLEEREDARQKAIDALPKKETIMPTE